MTHSTCRYQIDQIERKTNHVQLNPMFLQILPGRSLPMWIPDPQSGTRGGRLSVWRCLQVRPFLRLQALVSDCCDARPAAPHSVTSRVPTQSRRRRSRV